MSEDRSNRYRRKNYDRVSVLIEKPGRMLIDVLALREGLPKTELVRRALLARAGLRMLPYPSELAEELAAVKTQEEAAKAIRRLQNHETADEIKQHIINKLSPEGDDAEFTIQMDKADAFDLRHDFEEITEALAVVPDDLFADPVTVKLTGRQIGILRRFLANIEPVPQNGDDEKAADHNGL